MRDKKMVWVTVGVLLLAGLLWWVSGKYLAPAGQSPVSGSGPTSSGAMSPSYARAVQLYSGRRIQFDQYCQAIPSSMVIKSGSTIMLDNRSGDARTVKIGSNSYFLAGYGWQLVTLYAAKIPTTLHINCGSAVNVGTIIVE